jgi:cysteine desulfurase/selenocysteine lyase
MPDNGLDIIKLRADFPILRREVHSRPLVYFDNGATAQKPAAVIERMDEVYRTVNANVHRGVHYLSEQCTEQYEAARERVRAFINASSRREVIFTSGATAAINCVAHGFAQRFIRSGDNVILSQMEHHSNIVPWQLACRRAGGEIRVIPVDEQGRLMD